MPLLPDTKRHLVAQIHKRLKMRLAPITVVRGPRQIGKTTAQLHVIEDLLKAGTPPTHIFRVQFDELTELLKLQEPLLRLVDWYESTLLGDTLNNIAREGKSVYLFFDEVQNLDEWAAQLKHLVDTSSVQVVVTGSSALRIEMGRDSLAGRISTLEAGTLSLTEIGSLRHIALGTPFLKDNGLEPLLRSDFWRDLALHGQNINGTRDEVFGWFAQRGGYPLVHQRADVEWADLADQLNETVIKRVIQHDLRIGERGRKRNASLLEEVFRLACRYAGQCPSAQSLALEANAAFGAGVGDERIQHYLRFLGDTLLLRLIPPLEIRLKKKRGASKICLADHGLRASWLQEMVPLTPSELQQAPVLSTLAGHIAESVVGATLSTVNGLDISHSPERSNEPEVDFVLTVGVQRIPIEVKYQRNIDPVRDTSGVRAFMDKTVNRASFAILVTQSDTNLVFDPRIIALPLSSLMLMR